MERPSRKRWRKTPKGRALLSAAHRRYNTSPLGRENNRRYKHSPKGVESDFRYWQSPLGRENTFRQNHSPYAPARFKKYNTSPRRRKQKNEWQRNRRAELRGEVIALPRAPTS